MRIPGLTELAEDVRRIADALTTLAKHAEVLAKKANEDTRTEQKK